jgi:UPF0755 protein
VTVDRGLSSAAIARKLEAQGIIRARWAFQLAALIKGRTSSLKAGTYEFTGKETLFELIDRMASGDVSDRVLTIPEGLTAREVAERVSQVVAVPSDSFLAAVHDAAVADSLGVPNGTLEGYIFPDTYHVIPGTAAKELVGRLVNRMLELYDARFAARAESLGLSRHEALTLASLVEAEAQVDQERPRIAAVFWNRLKAGMKLQSDPTVAYALGKRPDRIFQKDLLVESPYNTYLATGLPPGPICSPGVLSIQAALFPTPDSREYYFVATGDGSHVFSTTNDEHNEARRRVAVSRNGARSSDSGGTSVSPGGSNHRGNP